jgi:hypothetical protein
MMSKKKQGKQRVNTIKHSYDMIIHSHTTTHKYTHTHTHEHTHTQSDVRINMQVYRISKK